MSIDPKLKAAIAVTRFGLGARPGEIEAASTDPAGYLTAQIRPEGADQPLGAFQTSAEVIDSLRVFQMDKREDKQAGVPAPDVVKQAGLMIKADAGVEFAGRAALASQTEAGFRERWALFWFNHFTVGQKNLQTALLAGTFEREAIRPNVFGPFEDLLAASTSHPGMLVYLDQAQSIGPNSPLAARAQAAQASGLKPKLTGGLNENLAREIMELHTLGVGSGYSQADVTEFARALTGWSIVGLNEHRPGGEGFGMGDQPGQFVFRPFAHEPGERQILGRTYPEGGVEQARAVLHDLAAHPATGHHIATKLAVHFVADDPPPTLTARLAQSFNESGGRLDKVAETLIRSPEAWAAEPRKMKTPYDFVISSYRAAGATAGLEIVPTLTSLGQQPFSAPSPKGWAEDAATWASPDGVIKRMDWSEAFAARAMPAGAEPMQLAENALGARLSPTTAMAVSRAESRSEAMSILLMSPEFQRR